MVIKHHNLFVITGGSRGIGADVARIAARDYPVVILYKEDTTAAQRLIADIRTAGGQAWAIAADVGDELALCRAFAQIEQIGSIAVLVNNAGITGGMSRVENVQGDVIMDVLRTNVMGAFIAAREAVRRMSTRLGGAGGSIINVSSGASVLGAPNTWIHYAASKGAIDTLTIGLSKEVAQEGIRVNAVRPGVIDTDLHHLRSQESLENLVKAIPVGRMGTTQEVANAIVWLASPAASYVTGCLMDVSGGL
jgi:NAD(P)-dependent dehydrogenase (short-subunit alcohol dehydrogenase family)